MARGERKRNRHPAATPGGWSWERGEGAGLQSPPCTGWEVENSRQPLTGTSHFVPMAESLLGAAKASKAHQRRHFRVNILHSKGVW